MLDLITISFSAAGLQQARPILELMVSFQHPAENTDFAWMWANFHLELEQKRYQVAAYSIPDSSRKKAMCLQRGPDHVRR